MSMTIHNVATTGSEQEFTTGGLTREVVIKPNGTALTISDESGGDTFSLADGSSLRLEGYDLRSTTFYLNAGTGSQTVEIIEMTGPET